MKRADLIIGKTENGLPQPSWTSKTSTGEPPLNDPSPGRARVIDQQTKALVNMIFARFMAIYGHKFKSAFETEDEIRIAKREWALSLAGYPENELVLAVNQCKETLAWMPTISEFLEILRNQGQALGVPSLRDAYLEACRYADHPQSHNWTHPIVYWSGKQTGWFELRSETEAEIFPRFSYQFELNLRRFRAGETFEDVEHPMPLEDRSDTTAANEMLGFARDHHLDEAEACKLLYYLTLPQGSRARARQYRAAQEKAAVLNLDLPTPH